MASSAALRMVAAVCLLVLAMGQLLAGASSPLGHQLVENAGGAGQPRRRQAEAVQKLAGKPSLRGAAAIVVGRHDTDRRRDHIIAVSMNKCPEC
ncbi:hypothetical protein ACP4OV_024092 [Aristida adscensionis]